MNTGNKSIDPGGFRGLILRAGTEQLPVLAPLFDAYREFYDQLPDPAATREFLARRIEHGESVVFLALADSVGGKALGFTQLYPTFSSVRLKPLWVLDDLFVLPEARRQGVAAALLERARRHAVDTGARGLELQTGIENRSAQALYEKLGWRRENDYYRYYINVDE